MLKFIGFVTEFDDIDVNENFVFVDDDISHFLNAAINNDENSSCIDDTLTLNTTHQIITTLIYNTLSKCISENTETKKFMNILKNDDSEEYYIIANYFKDKSRYIEIYKITTYGEFNTPIVSKWRIELENRSKYTTRSF